MDNFEKVIKIISGLGIPFLLLLFPLLPLMADFLGYKEVILPRIGKIGQTYQLFWVMFFLGFAIWLPKIIIDMIATYHQIQLLKEQKNTEKESQNTERLTQQLKQEEVRTKQIENIDKAGGLKTKGINQYEKLYGSNSTGNTL